jgi:hypothetical protein
MTQYQRIRLRQYTWPPDLDCTRGARGRFDKGDPKQNTVLRPLAENKLFEQM